MSVQTKIRTFAGNVGIGTNDPGSFRLKVSNGNTRIDSLSVTSLKIGSDTRAFVPSGVIAMWSGVSVPTGWKLCDGSASTPNLKDRFIVGAGSTYSLGATGGANLVSLTTENLPEHSHSGTTSSSGSLAHTVNATTASGDHGHTKPATGSQGTHRHTIGTSSGGAHGHNAAAVTGNGGAHNHNMNNMNNAGDHTHLNNLLLSPNTAGCYHYGSDVTSILNSTNVLNGIKQGARSMARAREREPGSQHTHNLNASNAGAHGHSGNSNSNGSHTHTSNTNNTGGHQHTVGGLTNAGSHQHAANNTGTNQNHSHQSFTTNSSGSGSEFDIRPKYYILAFIMKI